jgi:hypothetical protein
MQYEVSGTYNCTDRAAKENLVVSNFTYGLFTPLPATNTGPWSPFSRGYDPFSPHPMPAMEFRTFEKLVYTAKYRCGLDPWLHEHPNCSRIAWNFDVSPRYADHARWVAAITHEFGPTSTPLTADILFRFGMPGDVVRISAREEMLKHLAKPQITLPTPGQRFISSTAVAQAKLNFPCTLNVEPWAVRVPHVNFVFSRLPQDWPCLDNVGAQVEPILGTALAKVTLQPGQWYVRAYYVPVPVGRWTNSTMSMVKSDWVSFEIPRQ